MLFLFIYKSMYLVIRENNYTNVDVDPYSNAWITERQCDVLRGRYNNPSLYRHVHNFLSSSVVNYSLYKWVLVIFL